MKYVLGILCIIVAIILFFDLAKIQNINALYATIFFMLAYIFFNMKKED